MTRVILECVKPEEQRLEAYRSIYAGDWAWDDEGNLHIKVTGEDVFDDPEAFLVALHELVEARLCHAAGIMQAEVDKFDEDWVGHGEPGDDPLAPYRDQHRKALLIEFLMADFLGLKNYGTMK